VPQAATPAPAPPAPAAATPSFLRAEPLHAQGVVVDVHDLRKTYPDGTAAVQGVTFQVRRGEIFGFLGPNGAGKTTTMRILGTLLAGTGGRASVLGLDVARQAHRIKEKIGFAMQEVGMDDLATAREMLHLHAKLYGMSGREAKARAEELLATFDLAEHADRRVVRYSGGMQRRLDLAVSLVHTPEVLFLDEPSTGLDPKSRTDLWAVLRRLRREQGLTVLMSTHYMEEADALCDRIAIIHKGRIAAIDTPERLKRSVGADTLRVALAAEPTPQQWAAAQAAFGAANLRREPGALLLKVSDGGRALLPALRIIGDLGFQVRETKVQTPTLQDAYLHYTGARLDEDAGEPTAPKGRQPAGRKHPGPGSRGGA
jgi:ABC-2 type transport system ATP-binding protein